MTLVLLKIPRAKIAFLGGDFKFSIGKRGRGEAPKTPLYIFCNKTTRIAVLKVYLAGEVL